MTKAERFRYEQERAGPKKASNTPRRGGARWPGRPGLADTGINDDRRRHGVTASRNWSARAAKNAPFVLEDSPSGKPSRKSTRKGNTHMKPQHPLASAKRNEDRRLMLQRRAGRVMSPPNA